MRKFNAINNAVNFGKGKRMNENGLPNDTNEMTVEHNGEYRTIRLCDEKGNMVASIIVGPHNTHVLTNWFSVDAYTLEDVTKEGVV